MAVSLGIGFIFLLFVIGLVVGTTHSGVQGFIRDREVHCVWSLVLLKLDSTRFLQNVLTSTNVRLLRNAEGPLQCSLKKVVQAQSKASERLLSQALRLLVKLRDYVAV